MWYSGDRRMQNKHNVPLKIGEEKYSLLVNLLTNRVNFYKNVFISLD